MVQVATPQELKKSTNPIKTEKVAVGILDLEIVTESDLGREGVSCVNGQHSFFICTVRKGFTHLAYEINVDDNSISTEIFSSQIEVK